MSLVALAACAWLTACGGGEPEVDDTPPPTVMAQAAPVDTAAPEAPLAPSFAAPATVVAADAPKAKVPKVPASAPVTESGHDGATDVTPLTSPVGNTPMAPITLLRLNSLSTPTAATSGMIGAPAGCREGFVPGASLVSSRAAALPASGGATFSTVEQTRWSSRIAASALGAATLSPMSTANPGDAARISSNARAFLATGEAAATSSTRGTHGMKARDAAFYQRSTGQPDYAAPLRRYLLATAADPVNDFTGLCFRQADGSAPYDAYFEQAAWMLRYIVTYDYARGSLASSDRVTIENYIRRQAYFFATHLDWNLRMVFPNRLEGDYSVRARDARPASAADTWATKQYDTNGDCKAASSGDDTAAYPVYAWVDGSGNKGPRLSRLSLWFNNRKSAAMAAFGAAGLVLGDEVLVNRAKRYVMEWLTYSVWPDGSEGEYYRNGEYCVPRQGLIYAEYNLQAAALLAHWLDLGGDGSLARFSTADGLFGSASTDGTKKSIATVIGTELALVGGQLNRYYYEGWRSSQQPRAATHLGRIDSNYMGQARAFDNYHELGLLAVADSFANVPIRAIVLRDPAATAARKPGSTGNTVATGYGQWLDVFGALPAVLMLN
ncbi:hypothetical protein [Aquabacterium sp.]|uniref:hypothetical protein n=1 Tax=Aquabacterium sp. TaxID=1872578 RepID=UPI00378521C0